MKDMNRSENLQTDEISENDIPTIGDMESFVFLSVPPLLGRPNRPVAWSNVQAGVNSIVESLQF